MDKYLAMLTRLMMMDYAFNRIQRDMVLEEILDELEGDDSPREVNQFVQWALEHKAARDAEIEEWRRQHKSERAQEETPFKQWRKRAVAKPQAAKG